VSDLYDLIEEARIERAMLERRPDPQTGYYGWNEDDERAALEHQQELESRRWQEELRGDPGYFEWLEQFAAGAACERERI